jgi:hypothetical protein
LACHFKSGRLVACLMTPKHNLQYFDEFLNMTVFILARAVNTF